MSVSGGILRSARKVAVGTLMSRITGFVRTIVLAAVLGNGAVNNAYNNANVLPNIVFELLLGGVLTSVIVPLLVRAQRDAQDRGGDPNAYAQRLFTIAVVGLTGASIIGMLLAPLLVTVQGLGPGAINHDLAAIMAVMLLPQMIFYGIGALAGAVLNIRDSYGAPAWAPVANNVLVIIVGLALMLMSSGGKPTLETFSTAQLLLLSIGTTLGIVAQALILIPAWRKVGFEWKWRFDWRGVGLGELRRLAVWVIGYVLVGQVGFIVASNIANAADKQYGNGAFGLYSQWTYAALLFQLPYGILGVSLLTALMPKMSRAAHDEDWVAVKGYLADGTRLTGLALIPISTAFWILAVPLTLLFFSAGNFSAEGARYTGLTLTAASIGLLPYALTLLQLRVFFAAKDSRTPTLIMVGIVAVRVVLSVACLLLPARYIVIGLAVVNSIAFFVGAIIGDVVLRRRFGNLGTKRVLGQLVKIALAALIGVAVATPVYLWLITALTGTSAWNLDGLTGVPLLGAPKLHLIVILGVSSLVGLAVFLLEAHALAIPEIRRLFGAARRRLPF